MSKQTDLAPISFAEITEESDASLYYRGRLGQASREIPIIELSLDRVARWLTPPHGLLHLLQKGASPALATICLVDVFGDKALFHLWLKWEERGYGYTLRLEINKYPVEESEKQWVNHSLKKANQALILCLGKYPIHPFKPSPSLTK